MIKISEEERQQLLSKGYNFDKFCWDINPNDEIYAFLANHPDFTQNPGFAYVESGLNAFNSLIDTLSDLGRSLPNTKKILEFACGYGRVTRHLLRWLPPSRLDVSDIIADAVNFQKEIFNVNGLLSHADPEKFVVPERYDVIFVASLFSHLPKELWYAWLRKLHSLLSIDGLLIFSAHGPNCLPSNYAMDESGYCYLQNSESKILDPSIYGSTYVTKAFVTEACLNICGQSPLIIRERGIWNYQDIYVVGNVTRVN